MTRLSSLLAVAALMTACDSAESPTNAPSDEPASSDTDVVEFQQGAPDEGGRHRHRDGKRRGAHAWKGGDPSQRLCDDLTCTDEQRKSIADLFARTRGPEGERRRHRFMKNPEANASLAAAFRSSTFTTEDVAKYHEAAHDADRARQHLGKLAALHDILTAEQRTAMAEKIENEGFPGDRRFRHHAENRGGRAGAAAAEGADRVRHEVAKLCEPLSCTDEQTEKLAAVLGQARAQREATKPADEGRKAVAEAMRGPTFGEAEIARLVEAQRTRRADRGDLHAEVLVAVHGILDAGQRDAVAGRIERGGPRALLGHAGPERHGR